MEGAVELAVAAAIESVADRLAGAGGDRGGAGESGEGGFAVQSSRVRPGEQDLGGACGTDPGLVEQLGRKLADERPDLARQLAFFTGELADPAGDRFEREQEAAGAGSCFGRDAGRAAGRAGGRG